MSALAYAAQSIECGDAERRGEIAVRAAAGQDSSTSRPTPRQSLRRWNSCTMPAERSMGGRFKPPFTLDGAALVERLQRSEFLFERGRVPQAQHADIDLRARLGRHHIGPRAARNHARDSP